MVDVDKYAVGSPCWIELSTTDLADAQRFYREVLGWTFDSGTMPDGGEYVMPHLRDRAIGGMYARPGDQRDVPPRWLLFVAVNDADDTASRVTAFGGRLVDPPYDVMESGRMAVIEDPSAAVIAIWQANKAIGARVINEPGAFAWAELATTDPGTGVDFYCSLFGWDPKVAPDGSYTEFLVNEQPIGGMLKLEDGSNASPHWLAYFAAADTDATVARVEANGGRVEQAPYDLPNTGRVAVVADPQGARFGLFSE